MVAVATARGTWRMNGHLNGTWMKGNIPGKCDVPWNQFVQVSKRQSEASYCVCSPSSNGYVREYSPTTLLGQQPVKGVTDTCALAVL